MIKRFVSTLALAMVFLACLGTAMVNDPDPGSWAKLGTEIANNDATINFTDLSGGYQDFKVIGSSVVPVTDTAALITRISIAAAFKSGASDYEWNKAELDSGAWSASQDLTDTGISMMADCGSASGESMAFELFLSDPAGTALRKQIRTKSWGEDSKGDNTLTETAGMYDQATSAVDGIQFLFSTGNIESGTFTLYGRMN